MALSGGSGYFPNSRPVSDFYVTDLGRFCFTLPPPVNIRTISNNEGHDCLPLAVLTYALGFSTEEPGGLPLSKHGHQDWGPGDHRHKWQEVTLSDPITDSWSGEGVTALVQFQA